METKSNKNGTVSVPQKSATPRLLRKSTGAILIRVTVNGNRIAIAPDVPPIPDKLWNEEDRRARLKPFKYKGREFTGSEINATLELYINAISKAARLHPKATREELIKSLGLERATIGFYPKVYELIAGWLDITSGTRSAKKTIWSNIQEWFPNLSWETIDMSFYAALNKKLSSLHYRQPGKYFKEVKAMCRVAHDHDLPVSQDYTKKSFRVVWAETDSENDSDYLELDELDKLFEIDDPIINGFLIACYEGGLRHSDWTKASPENVHNGALHIPFQQKTKAPVIIPVHPRVKELWKRKVHYISSQKTNDHLTTVVPLYIEGKRITTKSARKTFATLNYRAGTPTHILYKLTGHATEKQLRSYLKVKNEDVADIAATLKFFRS